ncbi:hypothetical protein OSO01_24520 [Oceanobacillus sojae]|uniref:Uncharacterized protein n=1 Tax=Oceanobacillus sojae TaxID=582851 RepID=A0A511ZJU0_9BACI|nr:hypothetical protein OSO01_24520 [Oceanobacillus sojae]
MCIYFYVRGFSKVVILNLASLYARKLSYHNHSSINEIVAPKSKLEANDEEICKQLSKY